MNSLIKCVPLICFALAVIAAPPASAQSADASFFLTSNGPGKGGDLGGIAGADRHCQSLAQSAGAGAKTWRAYLSTQAADGQPDRFMYSIRAGQRRATLPETAVTGPWRVLVESTRAAAEESA